MFGRVCLTIKMDMKIIINIRNAKKNQCFMSPVHCIFDLQLERLQNKDKKNKKETEDGPPGVQHVVRAWIAKISSIGVGSDMW